MKEDINVDTSPNVHPYAPDPSQSHGTGHAWLICVRLRVSHTRCDSAEKAEFINVKEDKNNFISEERKAVDPREDTNTRLPPQENPFQPSRPGGSRIVFHG